MTARVRAVAASTAVVGLLVGTVLAPPAAADGSYEDTQWYFTNFGMAANNARADGRGVTVAVIDGSALNPAVPELADAKIVTQPASECVVAGGATAPSTATDLQSSHATSIAVMLVGNGTGTFDGRGGRGVAPGVSLLHYRIGSNTDPADPMQFTCDDAAGSRQTDQVSARAVDAAVAAGARVISLSFASRTSNTSLTRSIGVAESKGVVVVAGTFDGTGVSDADRVYEPAALNGVVAVNGIEADSSLADASATSDLVALAAPGANLGLGAVNPATGAWDSSGYVTGSSYATPFVAGIVAAAMSAYPRATSNQILQLLFRTTGGQQHDLPTRDAAGLGYGVPSLTAMLEHDPTAFPDENPLLREGAEPATSEILGTDDGTTSTAPQTPSGAAPSAATSDRAIAPEPSGSTVPWLLVGVAVAVVVVIAVVVLVVVVRRRGRGGPPGAPLPYGQA